MKRFLFGLAALLLGVGIADAQIGFNLPGWPPVVPTGAVTAWSTTDKQNINLTNNNTIATVATDNVATGIRSIANHNTGKWYFEYVVNGAAYGATAIGIVNSSWDLTRTNATGLGWDATNGGLYLNGSVPVSIATWIAGDTLSFAFDFDAHKFWGRVNGGAWNPLIGGVQNPTTGDGGADISVLTGPFYAYFTSQYNGQETIANFGTSGFAYTQPNGSYGKFEAWGGGTGGGGSQTYTVLTSTLTITGKNNQTYDHYAISTTSGPCVSITNSTNITIEGSKIGPCGTNNTQSLSDGIYATGNTGLYIYDNYIHVENQESYCTHHHDGIHLGDPGSPSSVNSTVNIKGNVIAYNEGHIIGWYVNGALIDGNFMLNVRGSTGCDWSANLEGHHLQFWGGGTNITAQNNYVLDKAGAPYLYNPASNDGLSCGGGVTYCTFRNNWVQYDPANSTVNPATSGVLADNGTNYEQILDNVVSNVYNAGINVAASNTTVSGNKVLMLAPTTNGQAQAFAVYDSLYSGNCSNITIGPNNIGYAYRNDGVQGFWGDTGTCSWTTVAPNTFGEAAYSLLYPIETKFPPPLIPPVPVNCTAVSPYSTQTSKPAC